MAANLPATRTIVQSILFLDIIKKNYALPLTIVYFISALLKA